MTAYKCLAEPKVKWKWLWFIFIMSGIVSLRLNWLTQVISITPIDIRWGAAGYWQPLFEPVTVYVNFPLGALLYWIMRRKKALKTPPKAGRLDIPVNEASLDEGQTL